MVKKKFAAKKEILASKSIGQKSDVYQMHTGSKLLISKFNFKSFFLNSLDYLLFLASSFSLFGLIFPYLASKLNLSSPYLELDPNTMLITRDTFPNLYNYINETRLLFVYILISLILFSFLFLLFQYFSNKIIIQKKFNWIFFGKFLCVNAAFIFILMVLFRLSAFLLNDYFFVFVSSGIIFCWIFFTNYFNTSMFLQNSISKSKNLFRLNPVLQSFSIFFSYSLIFVMSFFVIAATSEALFLILSFFLLISYDYFTKIAIFAIISKEKEIQKKD